MNESSELLPNLNTEITVPLATVETVIQMPVSISMGAPAAPEIQAAATPRLSAEQQNQVADIQNAGTPSRLGDMEQLLDPHNTKNAPIHLPGFQGAPFKGSAVPNLKSDDPQHRQPQIGLEPHLFILDLSKPEDRKDYEGVMTLIAHGYAVLSCEERVYDNDIKNWRVFLRWAATISYMTKNS